MNTTTAVTTKQNLTTVRQALDQMKPQFSMVLPKHITPERLCRVAITAIQNTPKLLDCDKQSLYGAIMRSAQLGLEPDGILGQAYLIPYGDKVQFIPGYRGLIDLARRSGEVSNIIAKEVCEKDTFKITWNQSPPFIHEQLASGDRGKVIGFWALANFINGGFHWDYMTLDEVMAIRNQSSGYKAAVAWSKNPKNKRSPGIVDSPWENNLLEMGKKTAIRRIAKYLPMSVQRAAMVEDLVDSGKQFTVDEVGDVIIQEPVIDNEEAPVASANKLDAFAAESTIPAEPAPVAAPQEEPETESSFNPAAYQINTPDGLKSAAKDLIAALEALPEDSRAGQFIAWGGVTIAAKLKDAGDGITLGKIKKLKIHLPE